MFTTISIISGTSAQWASANPVLATGEPGYDSDVRKMKIGDGSTPWEDLPFQGGGVPPDFVQESAEASWVVEHDLGYFPQVQIVDEDGNLIYADVIHNSTTQLTVIHSDLLAGTVILR